MSSHIGVRDEAPAGNAFLHILKPRECSFLHLYADALSSSNSVLCHIWKQDLNLREMLLPQRKTAPDCGHAIWR